MELTVIIAYLFGLMLLYILARLLLIPLRLAIRLLINGAIGGFLLWLVNLLGMFVGVYLPINPITALVAGFLGIPGVILLLVLKYVLAA
ncbi:MAG: pro-sigmaK processing inhibitor BofA family protein [Limnochordia bacterium]|jgi:inhibitor of the pro-sigma K processing machinery|nr:pro-sigmaK processing inhibitor BofA [Bacillota bacterium]